LSCRQLAEITKLSARTIEALESDRVSGLPAGIYRRAIVRAVASEVGLDPEQVLREFTAAHPDDLPAPTSAALVEPLQSSSRSAQKAMAFLGTVVPVLAAIVYFGWPAARIAEPEAVVDAVRPVALQSEILPAGGFVDASLTLPRPVVVTLTISSRCQLRIVADGREVLGRTVEQGESLPLELGDEILLLGDNASAVQFSINGQAGRLLGAPGDVLSVRIGRDDYEDFLVRY
jgi:hypothetical protein